MLTKIKFRVNFIMFYGLTVDFSGLYGILFYNFTDGTSVSFVFKFLEDFYEDRRNFRQRGFQ